VLLRGRAAREEVVDEVEDVGDVHDAECRRRVLLPRSLQRRRELSGPRRRVRAVPDHVEGDLQDHDKREGRECMRDAGSSERGPPHHGATSMPGFGDSPKLSGAYIASTREGGSAKRPGLFRRTVYSTTCLPRGMYS